MGNKLSINTISLSSLLKNGLDPQRNLELIVESGFKQIAPDERDILDFGLNPYIKLCKEAGIKKVDYVHLASKGLNSLHSEPSDEQDKFIEKRKRDIDNLSENGVATAVMHIVRDADSEINVPKTPNKHTLNSVEKLLRHAEARDVILALENSKDSLPFLDEIVRQFKGSKALGITYDSGHDNLFSKNQDIIEKYSKLIRAIHLHDNINTAGGVAPNFKDDKHMLPYDGTINFDDIITRIAKTGYTGGINLEVQQNKEKPNSKYAQVAPETFLSESYKRAINLNKMLDDARSKNNN